MNRTIFSKVPGGLTAVHQAAHVAVANALGVPLGAISIDTPCGKERHLDVDLACERMVVDHDHANDMSEYAHKVAVVLMAGETGELVFGGRMMMGADSDCARELLHQMSVKGTGLKDITMMAAQLIGLNRGLIERVAEELLARRQLSTAEVQSIISGVVAADGARPTHNG